MTRASWSAAGGLKDPVQVLREDGEFVLSNYLAAAEITGKR
jgi:hypothetical protein